MTKKTGLLILLCLLITVPAVNAKGIALSGRLGSMGVGVEATKRITSEWNARLGYNYGTYTQVEESSGGDIEYNMDLNLGTMTLLADWYPSGRSFHVTPGLIFNNNHVNLQADPMKSYTVGNRNYGPNEIGSLWGKIDFDKVAPYLGIGWGNPVATGKRFGMNFDLGIFFQNSPHVSLDGTGMIAPSAEQAPDVEDDLSGALIYLLAEFGITFQI